MALIDWNAAIDALTDTELRRNLDSVYDGDMNRTRRAAQRVIAQMPTIDAIPVEWLDDRANDITRAPLYRRYAQMLMDEWQKEQEATQ